MNREALCTNRCLWFFTVSLHTEVCMYVCTVGVSSNPVTEACWTKLFHRVRRRKQGIFYIFFKFLG